MFIAFRMLFSNFFEQIGDTNGTWPSTERERCFNSCPNVVGVHVTVVQAISADHHNGVADFAPCVFEIFRECVVEVEQEHHLVAQFTHINFATFHLMSNGV